MRFNNEEKGVDFFNPHPFLINVIKYFFKTNSELDQ